MAECWHNFREVVQYVHPGRKLFRASAPNYDDSGDNSQNLTPEAVRFLVGKGINSIISFNSVKYRPDEMSRLADAKIQYCHLPVRDFNPATLQQLQDAIQFFTKAADAKTLVHCGFGRGRTGVGVTAIQLSATKGKDPQEEEWTMWKPDLGQGNGVEELEQMEVLRKLRDSYIDGKDK